ncbi:MAG: hypothetical protein K2W93_19595 [Burkholderiaceae bacterium]|nr:hypothetical protein [Burkholderiaceae bacterium]
MLIARRKLMLAGLGGASALPSWALASAGDERDVTWVVENFEPYFIQSGPMKGKGIGDRVNQTLIDGLPDYRHQTAHVPILRITEGFKSGRHLAITTYLKNPADFELVHYSITSLVVPPLELTLRRADWQVIWRSAPQISLRRFLQSGKVIGVAGRRFYGEAISNIVADKQHDPKGVFTQQSTHYRNLAEMVARKRIDATIGYGAELRFLELSNPPAEPLVSVPIVENADYLYAHVAVPKTPWGEELRDQVDKVLRKQRNTPAYRAIMLDWFGHSATLEHAITTRFSSGL